MGQQAGHLCLGLLPAGGQRPGEGCGFALGAEGQIPPPGPGQSQRHQVGAGMGGEKAAAGRRRIHSVKGGRPQPGAADTALTQPVKIEHIRKADHFFRLPEEQMSHRVVLVDPPVRIAQAFPQLAAVEFVPGHRVIGGRGAEEALQQIPAGENARLFGSGEHPLAQRRARVVHVLHGAHGHVRPGFFQRGVQLFQIIRRHHVVRVHKGDGLAPGNVQPGVAGGGKTAVLLVDDLHPGVPGGIAVAEGAAAVGAAVVHKDELKIGKGLAQQALGTGGQAVLHLVHRHDDAHSRAFCFSHSPASFSLCSAPRAAASR